MSGFKVALAGNPNCGKTTLLNGLTGARHYVGNWAGVTVEKKEGTIRHKGEDITIVDLPGIYSLSPFTLEERISRQYILEDMPDMIINIVDASALERNLFLTFQLMELGRPVIIALNMMDEAEKRGIKIDVEGLSEALGLPIVPIVARKEKGLDALMDMVLDQVHSGAKLESKPIRYSEDLEQMIQGAEHVINHIPDHINKRWACIKLLERDEMLLEAYDISGIDSLPAVDEQIANEKYRLINDMMETVVKRPDESYDKLSAKLDKYILNQWIGIPIFALVMYFVFNMTFTLGGYGVDILDVFFFRSCCRLCECPAHADWCGGLDAVPYRRRNHWRCWRGSDLRAQYSHHVLLYFNTGRQWLHGPSGLYNGPVDDQGRSERKDLYSYDSWIWVQRACYYGHKNTGK